MNTESELAADVEVSEITESDAEIDRESLSQRGPRKGKYNKIIWNKVSSWLDIDKKEGYRLAGDVMTRDFNIAGGLLFTKWPEPHEKKNGPFVRRSVNICSFIVFEWMKCIR